MNTKRQNDPTEEEQDLFRAGMLKGAAIARPDLSQSEIEAMVDKSLVHLSLIEIAEGRG